MPEDPKSEVQEREVVVSARRLTKHYRHPLFPWQLRAKALTALDLDVFSGEVFGLLGPNGSGKSTTIKLLLGLNAPSEGEISIFGGSPKSADTKSRIGYLPEESYLYPYLNPEEILDFYARLFGIDRATRRARVESLLRFVGLEAERRRPLGEFSKGMQRRVALAQCLVNDPDLIILDEPTTGLDALGIAEIKSLVRTLKERGKTVLLCSHRMEDVEDVCDRIAILYGGRVQLSGTVAELLSGGTKTRVEAEMSDELVDELTQKIAASGAGEAVISRSTERLESLFLRVVEDARSKNVDTSGAREASLDALSFLGKK
ncbi:MAG: ABC transporter ATP-binding protein [Planctomycetota bacterium]